MFFMHQLSSERGTGLGIEANCSGIIEQTKKYKKHRLLQIKRSKTNLFREHGLELGYIHVQRFCCSS